MRHLYKIGAGIGLAYLTISLVAQTGSQSFRSDIPAGAARPWTTVPPSAKDGAFDFTVFGDRTGMAYPGRMEKALAMVHSQFIVSVGDNIEGYTRDIAGLNRMWNEFDATINASAKPFFRVPGNHDISNETMREIYLARFGRDYYSFVYENVLFLGVNTEDPPPLITGEQEAQIGGYLNQIGTLAKSDVLKAQQTILERASLCDPEAAHSSMGPDLAATNISNKQVSYFEDLLSRNRGVKWTFLFMHRPGWRNPRSANFARLQKLLANRNYTVIAGHFHKFKTELIDGHEYYTTGPTAALPRCNESKDDFDQVLDVHFDGMKPSTSRRWVE